MNKQDMSELVAKEAGISKTRANAIVNLLLEDMVDELVRGGNVAIRGFGYFKMKEFKGYEFKSPLNGKSTTIGARRRITFNPSKTLTLTV